MMIPHPSFSKKTLLKKKSALPHIIILGLFFLVASCSTKGPGSPSASYPDRTGKYEDSRNYNFDYRQDRLQKQDEKTEKELEQDSESFDDPATLLAGFADDLSRASLEKAITNQLQAMFEQELSTPVRLGSFTLTCGRLVETLEAFLEILKQDLPFEEFNKKISEEFALHQVGKGKNKKVLFTGYYRPIIQASPVQTDLYRYPIYQMPEQGLQQVKYKKGIQLVGTNTGIKKIRESYTENKVWRRFTREEIDHKGALKGQGLEVAWLKDDLERFFLHIQGSGMLEFPDGSQQGVGYQGSNQHSYTGIGKLMIRDGAINTSQGSMQGIKKYFIDHPQDVAKYLYQNKRYIFFSLNNDEGPRGSGGGELVGGRSIATDKSIYPAGGLAFIKVRQPVLDENNKIIRWQPISRFVVDQDTGSAIRGPGRGDLFFGTGQKAGAKAGHYHERGEVYYLIKRS
ncbi:MAG: MltA domain-containing protein [Nitrospinae bacterium]|nr:MltA domain-containing protein [Nitrospinota bacterium]MBL7021478.1 MltA domain-containing protein [Nitrospinaceae bacterium]